MAQNSDKSTPRAFIIQSPFTDPTGSNYVLGYMKQGNDNILVLQQQPAGLPQANQLFRVYTNGQIQNEDLGDSGYLTRVAANDSTEVHLGTSNPGNKDQVWNFAGGPFPVPPPNPNPVPGGGPNGSERYTIVADKVDRDKGTLLLLPALVLTAPVDQAGLPLIGQAIVVVLTSIPDSNDKTPPPNFRRLPNNQLFYFYWIPRLL
jgi:hypothetical protein